jgi:hypothetical protein
MMLADSYEGHQQLEYFAALRAAVESAARHPSALSPQLKEAAERLLHAHYYESETNDLMDRLLKLRGLAAPTRQWLKVRVARRHLVGGGWQRTVALGGDDVVARRLTPADMTYRDLPPRALAPSVQPPRVSGDAARVVAGMRSPFRDCYRAAVLTTPRVEGRALITIQVAADDSVSEVRGLSIGLPASMLDCLLLRASQAVFDAPDGGGAVITVQEGFVIQ